MKNQKKKKSKDLTSQTEFSQSKTSQMGDFTSDHISRSNKPMRRIHPVGMRVLVQIRKSDDTTDGGLYLPENAKDRGEESVLATVIEVASAMDDETDEETNISGIPYGATILMNKQVGTKVPWDDSLRVVETKDVLAVVDEVELV